MIRMRTILLPLVLIAAVGCAAKTEAEAPSVINANCPMMGEPVTADGGSSDFNGEAVGFCCPGCSKKFDALDDTEKTAKLAEANP